MKFTACCVNPTKHHWTIYSDAPMNREQAEVAAALLNAGKLELTEEEKITLNVFRPPLRYNSLNKIKFLEDDNTNIPVEFLGCPDEILVKMLVKAFNQVYGK